MYICIYVYMYIHIYIYIRKFVYMNIWIYEYIIIYMYTCIYVYMYICVYVYMYIMCSSCCSCSCSCSNSSSSSSCSCSCSCCCCCCCILHIFRLGIPVFTRSNNVGCILEWWSRVVQHTIQDYRWKMMKISWHMFWPKPYIAACDPLPPEAHLLCGKRNRRSWCCLGCSRSIKTRKNAGPRCEITRSMMFTLW